MRFPFHKHTPSPVLGARRLPQLSHAGGATNLALGLILASTTSGIADELSWKEGFAGCTGSSPYIESLISRTDPEVRPLMRIGDMQAWAIRDEAGNPATALTSEQLKTLLASVSESRWGKLAELAPAFEPYVRVQAGHSIDGRPLASVADYFAAVCDVSSGGAAAIYAELTRQVVRLNSVEGELELFSQRRSGGSASTVAPSAAAKGSATAGP